MQRAQVAAALLFLFALLLSACDLLQEEEKPEVDLTEIFPTEIPTIDEPIRINVDETGGKEWLVFYQVGPIPGDPASKPTAAAIYRPVQKGDRGEPPDLVPSVLWLPGQEHLCLHLCKPKMEEVISKGPARKELVVRDTQDKPDGDTVGVAIFRWEDSEKELAGGHLVSLGHFRADAITVEQDKVTLLHRRPGHRSLATQEVYVPLSSGRYYRNPVQRENDAPGQLVPPQETEYTFADGPPEEPTEMNRPEELVLAYYRSFSTETDLKDFYTPSGWEKLNQDCPKELCGCPSRRRDVSRVMVRNIAFNLKPEKTTHVAVQVDCIGNKDNVTRVVLWTLERQDKIWKIAAQGWRVLLSFPATWRLSDATVMGSGE